MRDTAAAQPPSTSAGATVGPLPPAASASRAAGVAIIMLTAVMWSFGGLAVKTAAMHPVAFAFFRSVFACAGMVALLPFGGGRRPPLRWMALTGALYTGTITLLIIAMTGGSAASGILLQNTAPVFCAMYAWAFQRRRIDARTTAAIAMALAGIGIMLAFRPAAEGIRPPLCGLASGICYAALVLALQHVETAAGGRTNAFFIVMCNNGAAAMILLPLWLAAGAALPDGRQLAIVAAAGLFQVGLPYVTFQMGLRRVHAVDASLLVLLEPVLNPTWVALAGIETPSAGTWAGGLFILAALVIDAARRRNGGAGEADATR